MNPPRISARSLLSESRAEAVIFDMDGVLADTEEQHLLAWQRLVRKHTGMDPPERLVRETFGQTNDMIIPQLWKLAGREPGEKLGDLSWEKEFLYREIARGCLRPTPGLERFLGWLSRRGVPLAIGTSGPMENVRFILGEFGWKRYFRVIVDRSRFASGKPAPDCFLEAARLLDSPPSRTLVFEDSTHGLLSARRGGFIPCGVATTRPESELLPYSRWVLRDFRDVAC